MKAAKVVQKNSARAAGLAALIAAGIVGASDTRCRRRRGAGPRAITSTGGDSSARALRGWTRTSRSSFDFSRREGRALARTSGSCLTVAAPGAGVRRGLAGHVHQPCDRPHSARRGESPDRPDLVGAGEALSRSRARNASVRAAAFDSGICRRSTGSSLTLQPLRSSRSAHARPAPRRTPPAARIIRESGTRAISRSRRNRGRHGARLGSIRAGLRRPVDCSADAAFLEPRQLFDSNRTLWCRVSDRRRCGAGCISPGTRATARTSGGPATSSAPSAWRFFRGSALTGPHGSWDRCTRTRPGRSPP